MSSTDPSESLPAQPSLLCERLALGERRLLPWGPSGTGKSRLAAGLAAVLTGRGQAVAGLAADPGSPAFGAPGAVCLGHWEGAAWHPRELEALCTLDAARFHLPLIGAVERVARAAGAGTLLVVAQIPKRSPNRDSANRSTE